MQSDDLQQDLEQNAISVSNQFEENNCLPSHMQMSYRTVPGDVESKDSNFQIAQIQIDPNSITGQPLRPVLSLSTTSSSQYETVTSSPSIYQYPSDVVFVSRLNDFMSPSNLLDPSSRHFMANSSGYLNQEYSMFNQFVSLSNQQVLHSHQYLMPTGHSSTQFNHHPTTFNNIDSENYSIGMQTNNVQIPFSYNTQLFPQIAPPFVHNSESLGNVAPYLSQCSSPFIQPVAQSDLISSSQNGNSFGIQSKIYSSYVSVGTQTDEDINFPASNEISETNKSYQCNICNKYFSSLMYLYRHKKRRHPVRRYGCDYCNKRFIYKSHLYEHRKVHTGETPYACDICKKLFQRRSHLNVHQVVHTNERPYVCNVCGMSYKYKNTLQKHIKNHHEYLLKTS